MEDTLRPKLAQFLADRSKIPVYGPSIGAGGCNVITADDADDRGLYIMQWDAATLGDWPTEADGFSAHQLKNKR